MNFLRWLVFERILPSCEPDQLFVTFVASMVVGGLLTLLMWPWFLPVTILIIAFWAILLYVVVSQWISEMREEWRRETGGDK